MKIFVINLKKNVERMGKISARLTQLGISFERIEAVYGRDLSVDEKRQKADLFHWWCIKGYFPRDGEIGCSLSHLNVYRRIVDEKMPCACILEDDTVMDERFTEQVHHIEAWLDNDRPQVVLLSNYTDQRETAWKILPTTGDSSTEAYIINLAAAQQLLNASRKVYLTADAWPYRVQKGWIELYHAFPTVVIPEWRNDGSYSSDVTPDNTIVADVRHMSIIRKIFWKCQRLIGLTLGRILYHD